MKDVPGKVLKQIVVICLRIHKRGVFRRRGWSTIFGAGEVWATADRLRVRSSSLELFLDHRFRRRMKWEETTWS